MYVHLPTLLIWNKFLILPYRLRILLGTFVHELARRSNQNCSQCHWNRHQSIRTISVELWIKITFELPRRLCHSSLRIHPWNWLCSIWYLPSVYRLFLRLDLWILPASGYFMYPYEHLSDMYKSNKRWQLCSYFRNPKRYGSWIRELQRKRSICNHGWNLHSWPCQGQCECWSSTELYRWYHFGQSLQSKHNTQSWYVELKDAKQKLQCGWCYLIVLWQEWALLVGDTTRPLMFSTGSFEIVGANTGKHSSAITFLVSISSHIFIAGERWDSSELSLERTCSE